MSDNPPFLKRIDWIFLRRDQAVHLDVIKTADYVIDLGPEGGHGGGEIVVTGRPETVAACARSHTGRLLKPHLR